MKTTGFKAMVVVLATMLTAGQAYAGWGGGRRGGGWYGPQLEQGIQDDTEEQGPWMRRRPERGGPQAEAWQGGPGRRLGRGQRMEGNWGGRFDGSAGPEARFGRGNRLGRGYQRADVCPYCQGTGCRSAIQHVPMRGHWEIGLRGGRFGRDFRKGEDLPGRGGWNRPGYGRGLQGRNIGPRGRNFEQAPMLQRGPLGINRGQSSRPDVGLRRGYQGGGFGPQGPGPMMRRGPVEGNQRQGYEPGRGGRGLQREEAPEAQEQGRRFGGPGQANRPSPRGRGGRGREGRPGLRRGPGGPVERPESEGLEVAPEPPVETDVPEKEPAAAGEDV